MERSLKLLAIRSTYGVVLFMTGVGVEEEELC